MIVNLISQILRDNRFTPENLPELEGKLFFEGDRRRPYLVRFTVLLFLSTIIAAYGVLADSTATVIGAMIIAPLMTPIVATTAALVMGQARLALHSILIVVAGVIIVVALSAIIGLITFNVISVTTNSQIASRVAPNLDDLIVALAAGTAAAFAYSRADVADSLPGVAIAIALVPPLSVVGITLSQGEWNAAFGAILLFLTNLLSILLAGGIVFLILDLGGASLEKRELSRASARRVYAYIALGVLLVTVPLAAATFRVAKSSSQKSQVRDITLDWLDRNDIALELREVNVFNQGVEIIVNGSDEPEPITELREELESAFPQMEKAIMKIDVTEAVPIPEETSDE
jgi:uncharacterized hydrophobic protein (TIGR00271 family)